MGTVPYGNPAGVNQLSPISNVSSPLPGTTSTPSAIPGGSTPSSSNPYLVGGGTVPGAPGTTTYAPTQQNLGKQWTDIYGKGTGGEMAAEFAGLQGPNSAAYNAFLASMQPTWAQQGAQYGQSMGAAGVSPNSTVNALGMSNLLAQQGATAAGVQSQMIQQNQQEALGLLTGTEQASAAEVASSGWDVFGQVIGDVGSLAGDVMGMSSAVGGFKNLFGLGGGGGGGISNPLMGTLSPQLGGVSSGFADTPSFGSMQIPGAGGGFPDMSMFGSSNPSISTVPNVGGLTQV